MIHLEIEESWKEKKTFFLAKIITEYFKTKTPKHFFVVSSYESVLRLNKVHPDQSGEFECRPQGLPSANVNLHIVKGNFQIEQHVYKGNFLR